MYSVLLYLHDLIAVKMLDKKPNVEASSCVSVVGFHLFNVLVLDELSFMKVLKIRIRLPTYLTN
jgi:hypothetical protein